MKSDRRPDVFRLAWPRSAVSSGWIVHISTMIARKWTSASALAYHRSRLPLARSSGSIVPFANKRRRALTTPVMRNSSDESTDDEHKASCTPSPTRSPSGTKSSKTARAHGTWSAEEHDRFLEAMRKFPMGPWSAIASFVGTRSVRQVHSHAQKYAAKVERHKRGQGKVKRSRTTGAPGSPSGHRIVPHILGKFHSAYEETSTEEEGSRRGSEQSGHGVLDSITLRHNQEIPSVSKSLNCGSMNDSPELSLTRLLEDSAAAVAPIVPHLMMATVPGLATDERLHGRASMLSPSGLPSLDESLDFFFRHFGTDPEAYGQVRHHHPPGRPVDGHSTPLFVRRNP